ncbi:hypothetical protein C8A00DRAFT_31542 [Chaetomidium leptoderma]|uniref:Uncharacterized protein n=1 Tax=Chaetomidium leptoderma TaxID=669021 RepID=A0AAN6VSG1_9PEZI|nr:hypothetical protein C8A00DRAFT_31542 [Chaetomidium leptoderma]
MPTQPPPEQETARTRRMNALFFDKSSSGWFGVSSVKFRVGAPPLRPLPVESVYNARFPPLEGLGFIEKAKEVLAANGLGDDEDADVNFIGRMVPGEPWTTQPTILIGTQWLDSSPKVWETIAIQLKRYVDEMAAPHGFDVAIEIMAPELIQPKYISPALDENLPKLSEDWPTIKDEVVGILELFPATASHMTTISLFRLGYDELVTKANPMTVYVSLDYESDQLGWDPVVQEIQCYLDGFEHDLHVHLEHNVLNHFAFPLVAPNWDEAKIEIQNPRFGFQVNPQYQTAVGPGADIGAARYITRDDQHQVSPLLGTLGCYLEIQREGTPGWTKKAFARDPSPETQNDLDDKIAFFDQDRHLFGKVWAGSGYTRRTKTNGRLDWALIEPISQDRVKGGQGQGQGINVLPDRDEWKSTQLLPRYMPYSPTFGTPLKPPPDGKRNLDQLGKDDLGYKIGTSTGATVGVFNSVQTDCKIGDEKYMGLKNPYSTEYTFIGHAHHSPDGRFGDFGDSGAVVFDEEGRALGLLFTGQSPNQCPPYGINFVIPIEDVFEDIKAFSKGKITGVRIANP